MINPINFISNKNKKKFLFFKLYFHKLKIFIILNYRLIMLGVYVLVLVLLYCEFLPTMTELEPSIDESNSNTDIHTMPNLEIEDIRDFFIKELSDVNLEPVVIDDEEFFNKILLLEQSIKVFEENLTRCLTNSKSITDEELRQILKILEHTIIVFENRLVKFSNDLNASDDNKKFIKERLEKLSILKQNIHEYDQILNNKNHFILLKLIPVLVVIILKYFVL